MFGWNMLDHGARWYDAAIGRWWNSDIMSEKHTYMSTYNSCCNNPINIIDNNGKDCYLIVWASQSDSYGHAAFGVDNYILNKRTGKYIKDGTISVYGLFPIIDYNGEQASKDERVRGIFYIDKTATIEKIERNDFNSNEFQKPDGILRIQTNMENDVNVKQAIDKEIKSNKGYMGRSRNCSTFARECIRIATRKNVSGEETNFIFIKYVTPNALFNETKRIDNTKVIVDPYEKTDYKFVKTNEIIKHVIK